MILSHQHGWETQGLENIVSVCTLIPPALLKSKGVLISHAMWQHCALGGSTAVKSRDPSYC